MTVLLVGVELADERKPEQEKQSMETPPAYLSMDGHALTASHRIASVMDLVPPPSLPGRGRGRGRGPAVLGAHGSVLA